MNYQEILKNNGINDFEVKYEDKQEFLVDILLNGKTIHLLFSESDMYYSLTIDVLTTAALTEDEKTLFKKITSELEEHLNKKIRLLNLFDEDKKEIINAFN